MIYQISSENHFLYEFYINLSGFLCQIKSCWSVFITFSKPLVEEIILVELSNCWPVKSFVLKIIFKSIINKRYQYPHIKYGQVSHFIDMHKR